MTIILVKRSSTPSDVPTTAQLSLGEPSINTYDGRLFFKRDNGSESIVEAITNLGGTLTGFLTLNADPTSDLHAATKQYADKREIQVAVSDESTDLTTGTSKLTFRMPHGMVLTEVRASVNTAPVGSTIIVDINEGGASILSTKLSIDANEKTSTTAATPAVISDANLADDAEITIDIDQIGSSTAGKGLKVTLIGRRT